MYSFEEMDYYLTIPGTWEGRCTVEQDGQSVRVSTDGAVNFTLLAVPNDEQAQQHENEVQEAGYQFCLASCFREGIILLGWRAGCILVFWCSEQIY